MQSSSSLTTALLLRILQMANQHSVRQAEEKKQCIKVNSRWNCYEYGFSASLE